MIENKHRLVITVPSEIYCIINKYTTKKSKGQFISHLVKRYEISLIKDFKPKFKIIRGEDGNIREYNNNYYHKVRSSKAKRRLKKSIKKQQ